MNKGSYLPLKIFGSPKLKSINYFEKKGSAQYKSSVIFGGMKANGITNITAKKSRNHTELLCKYLALPIKYKEKIMIKLKLKRLLILNP